MSSIADVLANRAAWHIEQGEALATLATLPDASVDALVTDPPAGIAFMAKEWDDFRRARNPADAGRESVHGRFSSRGPEYGRSERSAFIGAMTAIFAEAYRVLKPGAHGLVWAIPRTSHWTATALEDAGFEVRDRVTHITGQGFPKSKNLDGDWQGWGTALKPAAEDWWLVRKPLDRPTVAANVLAHGTGAINVDGCRIGTNGETWAGNRENAHANYSGKVYGAFGEQYAKPSNPAGRWPSHLILGHSASCEPVGTRRVKGAGWRDRDTAPSVGGVYGDDKRDRTGSHYADADGTEEVAAWRCVDGCPIKEMDVQSGERHSAGTNGRSGVGAIGPIGLGAMTQERGYTDTGGASRFFLNVTPDPDDGARFLYTAKASSSERNIGLVQCTCYNEALWEREDRRVSTRPATGTSRKRAITESTSTDGSEWVTSSSGSGQTALFPMDFTSTTSTEIRKTTDSTILPSSTPSPTSDSTTDRNSVTVSGGSLADAAASLSQPQLSTGISVPKDGRSTDDADPVISPSLPERSGSDGRCPKCGAILRSSHPTVKPLELMRWLCRLITPPGGIVLDCFTGSGSTGVAALREGFRFVGIERDESYVSIARARIAGDAPLWNGL